jgi:predicted DNA-binding transcriptional regulator AlpA
MFDVMMMTRAKPDRLPVVAELLTVQQVAQMTSLGVRTIWGMVATGEVPKPVKITASLTRWKRGDVMAWINSLTQDL